MARISDNWWAFILPGCNFISPVFLHHPSKKQEPHPMVLDFTGKY